MTPGREVLSESKVPLGVGMAVAISGGVSMTGTKAVASAEGSCEGVPIQGLVPMSHRESRPWWPLCFRVWKADLHGAVTAILTLNCSFLAGKGMD